MSTYTSQREGPHRRLNLYILTETLTLYIPRETFIYDNVTKGMSVGAAAAGIIAADFSAVHTDSPLQRSRWQRLPAAAQQF